MNDRLQPGLGRCCALTSPASMTSNMPARRAGAFLDARTFAGIVRNAPLVAVDLLIQCRQRGILLGMRINAPARNFWFVPGGRIFKNETIEAALRRIGQAEVGLDASHFTACRFLGVFEHFYEDDFSGINGFGTHYVVLAHVLEVTNAWQPLQDTRQHSAHRWVMADELDAGGEIHPYSRAYARSL